MSKTSFRVNQSYNWFNSGSVIVRMYFLNYVPFTFDDLAEGYLYDRDIVEEADKSRCYDLEDVYVGSQYLILESCHPCFDMIDIENIDELPEDLIPFFNEEDLRG